MDLPTLMQTMYSLPTTEVSNWACFIFFNTNHKPVLYSQYTTYYDITILPQKNHLDRWLGKRYTWNYRPLFSGSIVESIQLSTLVDWFSGPSGWNYLQKLLKKVQLSRGVQYEPLRVSNFVTYTSLASLGRPEATQKGY